MYKELVQRLHKRIALTTAGSPLQDDLREAADAIEELLRAAKKMHLWIFLHSSDEQAAYDECGLSDEMNAALGYSGQFELRAEPPKEDGDGDV